MCVYVVVFEGTLRRLLKRETNSKATVLGVPLFEKPPHCFFSPELHPQETSIGSRESESVF